MGTIIAVICFIIGIPVFLYGALIFAGLSIAGIIGSSVMIPAIIFATALLLIGAFIVFIGWRNSQKKKVLTVNVDRQHLSSINTSEKRRVTLLKAWLLLL